MYEMSFSDTIVTKGALIAGSYQLQFEVWDQCGNVDTGAVDIIVYKTVSIFTLNFCIFRHKFFSNIKKA